MTPFRENETFVCTIALGQQAVAAQLGEPAALVLESPQRQADQALDHHDLVRLRSPRSARRSGRAHSWVPASRHQPRTRVALESPLLRVGPVHVGDLELAAARTAPGRE